MFQTVSAWVVIFSRKQPDDVDQSDTTRWMRNKLLPGEKSPGSRSSLQEECECRSDCAGRSSVPGFYRSSPVLPVRRGGGAAVTSPGSEARWLGEDAACWAAPTRTGLCQSLQRVNEANHTLDLKSLKRDIFYLRYSRKSGAFIPPVVLHKRAHVKDKQNLQDMGLWNS